MLDPSWNWHNPLVNSWLCRWKLNFCLANPDFCWKLKQVKTHIKKLIEGAKPTFHRVNAHFWSFQSMVSGPEARAAGARRRRHRRGSHRGRRRRRGRRCGRRCWRRGRRCVAGDVSRGALANGAGNLIPFGTIWRYPAYPKSSTSHLVLKPIDLLGSPMKKESLTSAWWCFRNVIIGLLWMIGDCEGHFTLHCMNSAELRRYQSDPKWQ